jgi:hypothetical protein
MFHRKKQLSLAGIGKKAVQRCQKHLQVQESTPQWNQGGINTREKSIFLSDEIYVRSQGTDATYLDK